MAELVDQLPARMRAPLRQVLSLTATSLWLAPLVAGVLAGLLAILLLVTDPAGSVVPFALKDAEASRGALTAILSATIAATSLVITGTIIALQLATGQYSPRLLRGVLTDRGVRWPLGALVGTVVYVLVVISQTGGATVPGTAAAVGLLFGLGVIVILVFFTHHIVQRLRLETIVGDVTQRTLAAIDATHPRDHEDRDASTDVPDGAVSVPAQRSGYVQAASLDALAQAAAAHRVHLRVRQRVGDFLVTGTTAAWAWSSDGDATDLDLDDLAEQVDQALALGVDRTLEGDPAYGLRHLVDIGLRAVSAGVNDPTTAVQTIHHATRLLVQLASRPIANGVAERDGCRVVLLRPDLAGHLELAQAQLLQYGGGDARVVEALAGQLRDVLEAGTHPDRHDLVRDQFDALRAGVEVHDHSARDAELIRTALDRVERQLTDDTPDDEEAPAG